MLSCFSYRSLTCSSFTGHLNSLNHGTGNTIGRLSPIFRLIEAIQTSFRDNNPCRGRRTVLEGLFRRRARPKETQGWPGQSKILSSVSNQQSTLQHSTTAHTTPHLKIWPSLKSQDRPRTSVSVGVGPREKFRGHVQLQGIATDYLHTMATCTTPHLHIQHLISAFICLFRGPCALHLERVSQPLHIDISLNHISSHCMHFMISNRESTFSPHFIFGVIYLRSFYPRLIMTAGKTRNQETTQVRTHIIPRRPPCPNHSSFSNFRSSCRTFACLACYKC